MRREEIIEVYVRGVLEHNHEESKITRGGESK